MIILHFHLQPQYRYELFHINFTSLHCTGRYELDKLTSLPMCGFIAQLVEHRTGISRRSRVRIPLKPWFFSGFSFQLLKLEIYCDDHPSLSVITMSASSENLSGTLTSACSNAIASIMTAVVTSGKFDRHSIHFRDPWKEWLCLSWPMNHRMKPTTMEEDQAHASAGLLSPSGGSVQWLEDGQISSCQLWLWRFCLLLLQTSSSVHHGNFQVSVWGVFERILLKFSPVFLLWKSSMMLFPSLLPAAYLASYFHSQHALS